MEVASINVAQPESLEIGRHTITTGIYKRPVAAAEVTAGGVVGDSVCDAEHHGGADQAVYVYGSDDYRWFKTELGLAFEPGSFGENLTIDGLATGDIAVGDRLRIGDVVLEATAPRIPCAILGARHGSRSLPADFRRSERPGFYCRVVAGGTVTTTAAVSLEAYAGDRVGILELFNDNYEPAEDPDVVRRFLRAPVAVRIRKALEDRLADAD